jgi:hypothetical protein
MTRIIVRNQRFVKSAVPVWALYCYSRALLLRAAAIPNREASNTKDTSDNSQSVCIAAKIR